MYCVSVSPFILEVCAHGFLFSLLNVLTFPSETQLCKSRELCFNFQMQMDKWMFELWVKTLWRFSGLCAETLSLCTFAHRSFIVVRLIRRWWQSLIRRILVSPPAPPAHLQAGPPTHNIKHLLSAESHHACSTAPHLHSSSADACGYPYVS